MFTEGEERLYQKGRLEESENRRSPPHTMSDNDVENLPMEVVNISIIWVPSEVLLAQIKRTLEITCLSAECDKSYTVVFNPRQIYKTLLTFSHRCLVSVKVLIKDIEDRPCKSLSIGNEKKEWVYHRSRDPAITKGYHRSVNYVIPPDAQNIDGYFIIEMWG